MIKHEGRFNVVGQAAEAIELLRQLRTTEVDVLLMDIDMPGMSGLEAMPRIHDEFPEVRVLVFSMHSECEHAQAMLKAGAKGYLLKSARLHELMLAIQTVAEGGTYLSAEIASGLINALHEKHTPATSKDLLTDRELEVLKLVAKGLTNKEISEHLFISHRTVDTHRRHIMEKLDLHNAAALCHYAAKQGLLD